MYNYSMRPQTALQILAQTSHKFPVPRPRWEFWRKRHTSSHFPDRVAEQIATVMN